MTTIYRVAAPKALHHSDPLHVGRFYPHVERRHAKLMQDRQDLILYLANIHSAAVKTGKPLGFCSIPMRLMSLRDWVYDYKVVFDHFFDVQQEGYHVGDKFELSLITPKRLKLDEIRATTKAAEKLIYVPPPLPSDTVISKVYVQQHKAKQIGERLAATGRLDLNAPVQWLLAQPEVNFHFARSGRLQLRDTSVWPIQAIETWPSWLREELFGCGIDIESAYTQFLIEHIREAYADRPHLVQLLFPDLIRSLEDKALWRMEICCDVLGLEYTDENISIVKKICMSLANGSRISPTIMVGHSSYSVTRDIIIKAAPESSLNSLAAIGERLSAISTQYQAARKVVCALEMKVNPSRLNQKKVFASYFEWEREARYAIWEAVERHGIMVHDGIDGIPEQYLTDIPKLISNLGLRLTRN